MQAVSFSKRLLSLFLATLMLFTGLQATVVQAAVVSTQTLILQEQAQFDRAQLQAALAQEQAVAAMQALGVDAELVQERVASMTAEELQAFNQQVDEMQAGGSTLGVIVLVFLILILLDLLGATDIFPAIRPIN